MDGWRAGQKEDENEQVKRKHKILLHEVSNRPRLTAELKQGGKCLQLQSNALSNTSVRVALLPFSWCLAHTEPNPAPK